MMYYQKRFHCQQKRCCLVDLCQRITNKNTECLDKKLTNGAITFHLLIDKSSRAKLQTIVKNWHLNKVNFEFYDYKPYLSKLNWILSHPPADIKSCTKLLLPEILPSYVRQVISLDVDLMLNADINELWNRFRYFRGSQMIGLAIEQNPYFESVMNSLVKNWKGYGYNTGVILLNLAKLRSVPWNHLWMSATKFIMRNMGYLKNAEQDIINLIASRNIELFYEIPCEWNIQLSRGVEIRRCPVTWITKNKQVNDEELFYRNQPKIIHMNHQIKPEDIDLKNILNIDLNTSDTIYNADLLYKKYLKEYFKYRHVSRQCFY
nr:unnamed protein product [Trichobilharzia regenti]